LSTTALAVYVRVHVHLCVCVGMGGGGGWQRSPNLFWKKFGESPNTLLKKRKKKYLKCVFIFPKVWWGFFVWWGGFLLCGVGGGGGGCSHDAQACLGKHLREAPTHSLE